MADNISKNRSAKRDDTTFVNLMTDSGMKAVLADPDNKELLIELLNILLPEYVQVKDIKQYRDREKRTDYDGAKKTVLDLSCEGEDGSIFNVEVQRIVGEFFFERIIYYAAGEYHSQLLKGVDYVNLKPVYEIVFLEENLWHESIPESLEKPFVHHGKDISGIQQPAEKTKDLLPEQIVTRYVMKEEKSNIFAPSTIFCIFAELGRFKKTLEECRTKEDFTFYWFLNGWKEERIPEMFAKIPFCEKIAKACEVAAFSKEKYDIYQADMRSERDIAYFSNVRYERGLEEGLEKGREEGRKDEQLKIAKNLIAAGLPLAQIAQLTGLSEEEVSAL